MSGTNPCARASDAIDAAALNLMSLPHALLTALVDQPSSGSELAQRFDRSIGFFWHATHQQIYRELARLETAGWVRSLPAESTRGRKRAFRILPAGRRELKRWIRTPNETPATRDELMVRLRAEAVVGPTPALEEDLQRLLSEHQGRLNVYRDLEARDFDNVEASDRKRAMQHVVLATGMRYETYWIDTLTHALTALRRLDAQ